MGNYELALNIQEHRANRYAVCRRNILGLMPPCGVLYKRGLEVNGIHLFLHLLSSPAMLYRPVHVYMESVGQSPCILAPACVWPVCQALPGNMPLSSGVVAWLLGKYILSAYDSSQSLQPP